METDNVFSDQMQVSRPQFCILFRAVSVCIITDSRDIVCQRVKPYINDMLIVKINRNSPLKRSSGYAQILKSRKKEVVHHLVLTGFRLNEFRMCLNLAGTHGRPQSGHFPSTSWDSVKKDSHGVQYIPSYSPL